MATYSKVVLSGSTNGKQIKVTGTTTGTSVVVHTAGTGTPNSDEIWIYATNNSTAAVNLTIEWGAANAEDLIQMSIPSKQGLYLLIPGLVLNNGLPVKAWAATANVISLSGWVNRITA